MSDHNTAPGGSSTDLGALWTKAVNDYVQKTGNNIDRLNSQSLHDVMEATSKEMKTFGGFRHDGGKVDKVRSAFQKHLGMMQKCLDGLQMAGSAVGAFPPAMPVGIVFSACGHLLSAFAAASAQYDKVESFFNHISRFFERLSLLEGKAGLEPLAVAIIRVFCTQLSICGIAQRLASSGRVKTFFNMLWSMEDPELAASYAAMQSSIEELGATVGYASYSAIRDTHEDVGKMSDNIDSLDARIVDFRSTLTQDIHTLYLNNLALDVKMTQGFASVETKQDQSLELQLYLAQTQDEIMKAIIKNTDSTNTVRAKGNAGNVTMKAAMYIRNYFESHPLMYPGFNKVYDANLEQHEFLERSLVSSSSEWLFQDTTYLKWRTAASENVWIQASDGTGKSCLTCAAHRDATERLGDSVCCGYFYFFPNRESVETALACMVMQIVARSDQYAEAMAAQLRDEAASPQPVSTKIPTWQRFLTSRFSAGDGLDRLLLFIDGFDEAQEDQKQLLIDLAEHGRANKARISLFLTTRRTSIPKFGNLFPAVIHITKERVIPALTILIKKHLEARPQLKRLSKGMKRKITRELLIKADSMLYVDLMLRRFASIGRESVIFRALNAMPISLTALFELFEQECMKGRTYEQLTVLKALFAWMTYSQRALTISEASMIITQTVRILQDHGFAEKTQALRDARLLHNENEIIDIEGEITGRCARFLRVSRQPVSSEFATEKHENSDSEEDEPEIADLDNDPRMVAYREAELVFQDFATRRFFLHSLHDGNSSETTLRVQANEAHISILEVCVDLIISLGWSNSSRGEKPNSLQRYALDFWTQHLERISVDSNNAVVLRVINILHHISVNVELFSRALQRHGPYVDIVLPQRRPDQVAWYDLYATWVDKASFLGPDVYSYDIQVWMKQPAESLLLLPLARGFSLAWVSETVSWGFTCGYLFTRRAIELSSDVKLIYQGSDKLEEVSHYARLFTGSLPESFKVRAIMLARCYLNFNETHNLDDIDTSYVMEQLRECSSSMTAWQDRAVTMYHLGSIQYLLRKEPAAIEAFEAMLHEFDMYSPASTPSASSFVTDQEVKDMRKHCVSQLSGMLSRLGRYQQALNLSIQSNAHTNSTQDIILANIIGIISIQKPDPTGQRAMAMLKSWTKKQRQAHFNYVFRLFLKDIPTRQESREHARPARRTGEMVLYLRWLEEGKRSIHQQNAAALIYEEFLHNDAEATRIRLKIFASRPFPYDNAKTIAQHKFIQEVNWRRNAAAVYRQFTTATDFGTREKLLDDISSLPILHFRQSNDLEESQVAMLKIYMLRALGPFRNYQRAMDTLFNLCIANLSDGVSYNDAPSLRLFTKVLALLPVLECDAQIAYSAQFSILDREVQENTAGGAEGTASYADEDLTGISCPCNGCGRRVSRWTSTQYMCLTCLNLDLCEECYGKEKESHRRVPQVTNPDENGVWEDEKWHSLCDDTHAYVKGPMKDWKGVQGGVIRIGDKEVGVKEWLQGLKEVRWRTAWEQLWRSQSGLRDIGIQEDDTPSNRP